MKIELQTRYNLNGENEERNLLGGRFYLGIIASEVLIAENKPEGMLFHLL